jgi:hypothetical protein
MAVWEIEESAYAGRNLTERGKSSLKQILLRPASSRPATQIIREVASMNWAQRGKDQTHRPGKEFPALERYKEKWPSARRLHLN